MPSPTRKKKRSRSTHARKIAPSKRKVSRKPAPKKKRARKKRAPKRKKVAPKKRSPAKKRAAPKRKRAAPKRKRAPKEKISAKKRRLLDAMAEIRMRHNEGSQPLGWSEHRHQLRLHDGKIWRRITHEFSQEDYDAERLRTLEELEIDFLTRDELYDYLSWLARELEIDISDMYRMYLGYSLQVGEQ